MNYVKNGCLESYFCEKCNFENVIFVKKNVNFGGNGILRTDFCEKCNFENAIFV